MSTTQEIRWNEYLAGQQEELADYLPAGIVLADVPLYMIDDVLQPAQRARREAKAAAVDALLGLAD